MLWARRLAAIGAVLTLCVGNLAVCAGWQATAEARMACCASGTTCPMHKSASDGRSATHMVSQAQADTCCGGESSRTQSSIAGLALLLSTAPALSAVTPVVVPPPVLALQNWRALVPLPASPIPRHLLISVLLV